MISPGYKSLGSFTITTAGTQVGEWVDNVDGILALLAKMRFIYGSGTGTVKAYLQTSADQGSTVTDIWCRTFATANDNKERNFSALTPTSDITPTDGTLSDNTAVDGVLGDRFRVKLVSTGTYAGSTQLVCSGNAK